MLHFFPATDSNSNVAVGVLLKDNRDHGVLLSSLRPYAGARADRQTDRRLPGLQRVGSNRCKWESAAELPMAEITLSCEPQLLHFLADSLQVNCEGLMALLTGFCGEGRGGEGQKKEGKTKQVHCKHYSMVGHNVKPFEHIMLVIKYRPGL